MKNLAAALQTRSVRRSPLPLLLATCALVLATLAPAASAHDRWRGGIYLNYGWHGRPYPYYWGPRYYFPPPVYYSPAPVIIERVERTPPVYIEKDDVAPAAPAPAEPVWWYWCASAGKYYPYVQQCAGGFQRVPPQPVPTQPAAPAAQ